MAFEAHGHLDIEWQGNKCILHPKGAVNAEGAQQFNRQVEAAVHKAGFREWYRIECLEVEELLGTPESYDLLYQNVLWSAQHGCQLVVLVNPGLTNQYHFERACRKAGMASVCAANLSEAIAMCDLRETDRQSEAKIPEVPPVNPQS